MPVGRSAVVKWLDEWSGLRSEQRLDRLDPAMRMRLFRRGPEGLEPLWLWVSEAGLPFESHSWNGVFAAATRRCRAVLGAGAPFCTPHMARHSFALYMLIALHHVMDRRFGLSPDQRRDFAILYGDPWRLVKELLGHRSEATTRNIYLAPVAHVHIRSLLEGDMDERAEFLQEVAVASGLVQDVE
jgi:integrase